jgi:hypothetical protein
VGHSREIIGLVTSIVTLLAMGVAVAKDATWRDCELAARDPDRSIAACSKILKRPSSKAHAAAFHHRGQAYAEKGTLTKQSRISARRFGSIQNVPIAGRSVASFTLGRASTNKPSLTLLKRSGKTQLPVPSDFKVEPKPIKV